MNRLFKLVVLVALAVFAVAMLAPLAWAEEKVIIKYRDVNKIMEAEWDLLGLQQHAWRLGSFMDDRYPVLEVLEIDGVPWQDTIYADIIKENLTFFGDGYLSSNPELIEIVTDKRFNGKGAEVWRLFKEGKSVQEIKQILLDDQQGEQQDEQQDIQQELPPPKPDEISVVLYLDRTNYSVAKNGTWQEASLDVAPILVEQRTLVPLRGVLEQFGANVEWVPGINQVKVKYKDKEVVLTLDSTDAVVNGQVIKLDVPARVVKGRTLIPLRFVSEQIGMNVKWDGQTKSIIITE